MKLSTLLALAFLAICGLFTLILCIVAAFNLLGNDAHISDRIKDGFALFLVSFILFIPLYEYVKKRFYGKKTWSEVLVECYSNYLVMSKLSIEDSFKKNNHILCFFYSLSFLPRYS